jgi:hypothetical protein
MTSHTREGKGLTVAQSRMLANLQNGWTLSVNGITGNAWVADGLGFTIRVNWRTFERLSSAGTIEPHERINSVTRYRVTDAGRLALSQSLDAGK